MNNPAGRFFSKIEAVIYLCADCREFIPVAELERMMRSEMDAVRADTLRRYFNVDQEEEADDEIGEDEGGV